MKNKQNNLVVPLAEAQKHPDLLPLLGVPLMAETAKDNRECRPTSEKNCC